MPPLTPADVRRLPGSTLPPGSDVVGSYWTRANDPEIDIVVADREPVAQRIVTVGSIKWLERKAFDTRDAAVLMRHRAQLPGADDDTPMIAVSRNGVAAPGLTAVSPSDLLAAWSG